MEEQKFSMFKTICREIEKIPIGEVFDSSKFNVVSSKKPTFNSIISVLAKKGIIVRLAKGKYCKPVLTSTQFSIENKIIKALTNKDEVVIGYLTGLSLYYRWKLTDHKPNYIHIAVNSWQPERKVHCFKVKFRLQSILITKENIQQLKILDALKDINKIPGTTSDRVLKLLIERISHFNTQGKWELLLLSQKYTTSTQILLCAIFEYYFLECVSDKLQTEFVPYKKLKLDISYNTLPNKDKWKIV